MSIIIDGPVEVKRISALDPKLTSFTGYNLIIDKSTDTKSFRVDWDVLNAALLHNSLSTLQGGQANQYYHLNQAAYDVAKLLTGAVEDGQVMKVVGSDIKAADPIRASEVVDFDGVYNVDFRTDFESVVLDGNVTSVTFSNIQLGKPVMRVFDMQGYSITFGSEFEEMDNFVALDNTVDTKNWLLLTPEDITVSSEIIVMNNATRTP